MKGKILGIAIISVCFLMSFLITKKVYIPEQTKNNENIELAIYK